MAPERPRQVEPAVYSAGEVAVLLGVSQAKVYDLAHSGRLPCKRVGRRFLFPRAPILEWLNTPDAPEPWHG